MQNDFEGHSTTRSTNPAINYRFFLLGGIIMTLLLLTHLIILLVGAWHLSAICGANVNYVTSKETELSLTETNKGRAKKGELIFNEQFNTFNLDRWEHEITMSGGGNGEFQLYDNNRSNSYVKFGKLYIKPTLTSDKYGTEALTGGHTIQLGGGATADYCTNDLYQGCSRQGTQEHPINPIMSARIRTLKSFTFKYGTIETKAKIPTGDWLWPAIWMMPEKNQYGGWPASGEIDLVESRGNLELYQEDSHGKDRNIGVEKVSSTLHFGPFWSMNAYDRTHVSKYSEQSSGFNEEFHVYKMEWTPEYIRFSIDDKETGTIQPDESGFWKLGGFSQDLNNPWEYSANVCMAPFDQRFYIIVNVAVGGTNGYFPDDTKGNDRKPWQNSSPEAVSQFWNAKDDWWPTWKGEDAALQVDYIKVWAL